MLSPSFAKGILLRTNGSEIKISSEAQDILDSWGSRWVGRLEAGIAIPAGPYYAKSNALWKVLRLYDDDQGTFVVSTKPADEDGTYGTYNLSIRVIWRYTAGVAERGVTA